MTQARLDESSTMVDEFGLDRFEARLAEMADRLVIRSESALRIIGSGHLPHAANRNCYELPAAVVRTGRRKHVLWLTAADTRNPFPIKRTPALPIPAIAEKAQARVGWSIGSGTDATDHAIAVLESFRYYSTALRNLATETLERSSVIQNKHATWMPSSLFEELITTEIYEKEGPPVLPITKVQQRLHPVLGVLQSSLRRQLRRERRMLSVGLVQSIDTRCIDWLIRQPGKDLRQRAGPRQQILAVQRQDTTDTYENRVLKLCLKLICECVDEYAIAFGTRYRDHTQVCDLLNFRRISKSMLSLPEIHDLPTPSDTSKPNYVLQYGKNYSDIWWAFEVLRRQKSEADDLWRWRHRICGEMLAIDFVLAAARMDGVCPLDSDREVGIRGEPMAGHWIHPSSSFPPRLIRRCGSLYQINVRLPLHAGNGCREQMSCDVEVVISAQDRQSSCRLPIVALASGLDQVPTSKIADRSVLYLQQGDASVTSCPGLDRLPLESIGTVWPLRPSDRREAAMSVLDRLIGHLVHEESK